MAVAISDRRAWTAPGTKDAAERTYASVKAALEGSPRLRGFTFEIFLQGSYANATNLKGDSDVDIVVMLLSAYIADTTKLMPIERAAFESARIPATVTINTFRDAVRAALVDTYGSVRVHDRNKCLLVDKRDGYIDADVVPAYEHRLYRSFPVIGTPSYIQGIEIRPLDGGSIVNYPKEHIKNGQTKNSLCNELYKPTVRQVKRLANHAAGLGLFAEGAVPGYVLECMVYNIHNDRFVSDDAARLQQVLDALHSLTAEQYASLFWSCDGIHHLFADDPGRHNQYMAKRVLDAMWSAL